ncbi:hypothetical protein AZO1586I_1515 [Bathymodiolus thermophilus thioautotrophic gill symbiont]|jgi:hypothetical protein|uniref:Membrane protein containing DUF1538 n=3 Tax=sulfur-oxidizing symbionts TaxID=32036 RepID=A0A1H6K9A8_9GAMM|nr:MULTISPECIES: DUF1538 domain-containing protein [sulfur-oxidizing symbionts]CAC9504234.1 FIG01199972: hypothetical protein [uncultured Gammaproteobacteria bacterium]CAB5502055.1 hypothetical protein AZO1586R_1372 [Bathymodiolus azoricus thioautotrophic gill symbiont]CAB5505817.1 hypothetical protein AZO1586I_1515 [Bathymodiolus thermophilus thioautotrophic gill symbiont]CAC9522215.1 FIG01199972: hypothetical protein [uncultured Gammaproteobacteria bacterium]CAC9529082.1 FIG01199972: hypothe
MVDLFQPFVDMLWDVAPIALVLFGFQFLILKQKIPHLKQVIIGFVLVWIGLTLFIVGLEKALFPLGKLMADQLTSVDFIGTNTNWGSYYWVYIFAFAIGFATTIAEPSLLAVAIKANQVSGGFIKVWSLRITVALGVAVGISLGSFRIVAGLPIHYFIIMGYVIVLIQTYFAPKNIIALAYDTGGVTTSTVTVPLVAALGLGLASTIEGRNPIIDGFGLIAFASLFPIISVLAYAQITDFLNRRKK